MSRFRLFRNVIKGHFDLSLCLNGCAFFCACNAGACRFLHVHITFVVHASIFSSSC